MTQLRPGGEPYLHLGDDTGCLLVHGLTATPGVLQELGQHLSTQGRTVHGVRLFGHATRVQDLERAHYRDWLASVEDGWSLLRPHCRQLYLIGHSLGGSLCLTLANELNASGIVSISALDRMPFPSWARWFRWLRIVIRRVPKSRRDDWHDPTAAGRYLAYDSYPVNAAFQFYDLLQIMQRQLAQIRTPVLFIQPPDDRMTGPRAMSRLYGAVGSLDKEMLRLEGSNHIAPMDAARQDLFAAVSNFIERIHAGSRVKAVSA